MLYIGAATGATYSCAGGNLPCRLSAPLTGQSRQTASVYGTGCRSSCGTRFLCCWPLHGL